MLKTLLFVALLSVLLLSHVTADTYYWSSETKIPLIIDSTKITIKLNSNYSEDVLDSIINAEEKILDMLPSTGDQNRANHEYSGDENSASYRGKEVKSRTDSR